MAAEELDKQIADSPVGQALRQFGHDFGWEGGSSHRDHRGFQGPWKYVTSYKMMNFEYGQWRVVFSALRASDAPGDFAENFLTVEFGATFAREYLATAPETAWLDQIRILHDQVMAGLREEPIGWEVFDQWKRQMIEDGYYEG